jgi:hypothetical protein
LPYLLGHNASVASVAALIAQTSLAAEFGVAVEPGSSVC